MNSHLSREAHSMTADDLHARGLDRWRAGDPNGAAQLVAQAISLAPTVAVYRNSLGAVLASAGHPAAEGFFRSALSLAPGEAATWSNIGHVRRGVGPAAASAQAYARALTLDPWSISIRSDLTGQLRASGAALRARKVDRQGIALAPGSAEGWRALASDQRHGDPASALKAYGRALAIGSDPAMTHHDRAMLLFEMERFTDALTAFEATLRIAPSHVEARFNRALALQSLGRDATAEYCRAFVLAPDHSGGWSNFARLQHERGDLATGTAAMRRAHAIRPDWPPFLADVINFTRLLDGVTGEDELRLCRRFDELYARPLGTAAPPVASAKPHGARLRIGYLGAACLRRHTAAVTLIPLMENHDRERFEIVCYSDLPTASEDAVTRRFRSLASAFHVTHDLSDEALARRMRADGIDVAVDIQGYPPRSRLLTLARRPAPVQVNLLLMGSFGLEAVGWAIGDPRLTPPELDAHFSERLARIDLAFAYDPLTSMPDVSPLPAARSGAMTFGSLNQPAKMSPRCLATWARVLQRIPGSRLILKGKAFSDPTNLDRMRAIFANHAVEPERIDLRGWTAGQDGHLAIFQEIDIALDPFPYGGVISTCEALWMGIPVVTLLGDRVLGRYSAAFLDTVGLSDLVATDVEQYVEHAVGLARDLPRLETLRATLRQRMAASLLCDGRAFAQAVEGAFGRMWKAALT